MSIVLNGTTGITNDGGYTGDGVVFADTTPANTLVTTTGGNVGIGTTTPAAKLTVNGDTIAPNFYFGASSAAAGTIGATSSGGGANIQLYGSTSSLANTIIFATSTGEQSRLNDAGLTARQIYSYGTNYNTQSNYDVAPTAVTLAHTGFIDSGNFSGMFLLNNYSSGGVSIWLCGGGNVSQVSSVSGGAGMSVTFNAGISGYTIQNLTGSTVTLGIFKVRTRANS
jgi:hypothetical protein